MSYGRHRAVKYIAGCFIALGVLLIGLSTDDKSALTPLAKLKAASGGFTVQDFAGTTEGDSYWPGLRVYSPFPAVGKRPVVIFIHGGGWVRGTIEDYDPLTRGLALLLKDFVVVSVDYRLAPATKFPGALADCAQAVKWVCERAAQIGGDITRVAIAGDSAGGNLAIALALLLQREGLNRGRNSAAAAVSANVISAVQGKGAHATLTAHTANSNSSAGDSPYGDLQLCAQLFVYPVTDSSMSSASYIEFSDGPGLTKSKMGDFWRAYLKYPVVEGKMVSASPALVTKDELKGMPPTAVWTAEIDVLRDEGEAFAAALKDAGVDTTTKRYASTQHGFLSHLSRQGNFADPVWADTTAFFKQNCRSKR